MDRIPVERILFYQRKIFHGKSFETLLTDVPSPDISVEKKLSFPVTCVLATGVHKEIFIKKVSEIEGKHGLTCSGALPTKLLGSKSSSRFPCTGEKYADCFISSTRLLSRPFSFTSAAAICDNLRISSWHCCKDTMHYLAAT